MRVSGMYCQIYAWKYETIGCQTLLKKDTDQTTTFWCNKGEVGSQASEIKYEKWR